MSEIIKIIRTKREDRTNKDLWLVWNKLLDAPFISIRKSSKVVNDILDRLLFTSKSRIMSYEFCQTTFKYSYIFGINPPQQEFYRKIGGNLHYVMEILYNYVNVDDIIKLRNIKNYIYNLIYSLIPEKFSDRIFNYIDVMVKNIALFEDSKVQRIRTTGGLTKENLERYYYPIKEERELGIENYITYECGKVDATYNIYNEDTGKDSILVVDYKFGVPKYMDTYIYAERSIRKEVCFYKRLMKEAGSMYIDKDGNMQLFQRREADYGMIIYFQDLRTAKAFKMEPGDYYDLSITINKYWDSIENNSFNQIHGAQEWCMDRCPYFWKYCYPYENKWKILRSMGNIFSEQET